MVIILPKRESISVDETQEYISHCSVQDAVMLSHFPMQSWVAAVSG